MSDELIINMGRREAEELVAIARSGETRKRIAIFLINKRDGFLALGYKDFGDFCEDQLEESRQTAYNWINQVQTTCDVLGITITDLSNYLTNEKASLLPVTTTNLLRKLPSPSARREAWSQIEALKQHGMRTPREINLGLKKLVTRMLKSDSAPVSQPSQPMPSPSAFDSASETRQPEPAATAPTTTNTTAETPKATTVKSYTPPADPEPMELFELDFENAADVLNTCLTWVQNQEIDGDSKAKKWAIGSLCEVQKWIEANL